jgi:uncharacterized HAD superfamily protein
MNIGVDCDDVLAQLYPAFFLYHNVIYGTTFTLEKTKKYYLWETYPFSYDHFLEEMQNFIHQYGHKLLTLPNSNPTLQKLSDNNTLYVITSRPNEYKNLTLDWINTHYPGIFNDVFFGNSFSPSGPTISKSQFCEDLSIDILIEDALHNAEECAEKCEVLLLDYPWNSNSKHPSIQRVSNWNQILEHIELKY